MKAIRMSRTGEPDVLELVDVPTPVAAQGQALVKAHTIGVNMPEVHVRRGRYSWMPPLPVIPGIEMSGTIAALGSGVRDFSVGQPVYVSARELPHRCGCYAEYIAVDTKALLALPPEVDLEAAATLSSYQVAWHLLNSATRGFEYESVLITAAAGGIGSACVQLATAAGKRVIALVSSEAKAAFARNQGARTAVVENEDHWGARILEATGGRGADLILDAVAGARFPTLFEHTAPLGLVIQYGYLMGWPDSAAVFDAMRTRFGRSPALRLFSMHTFDDDRGMRRAANNALLDLFVRGVIRPVIQERIPLAEAARAHALLESGKVLGKLVLEP
ncbi:MAG TPA: zinc-dependent alcohol dehydrogenase family protein [Burkholderiales bacterium]|nr:zinc-dependent alcohol dehydrogenase family protein [Burkholderiales bacterium]